MLLAGIAAVKRWCGALFRRLDRIALVAAMVSGASACSTLSGAGDADDGSDPAAGAGGSPGGRAGSSSEGGTAGGSTGARGGGAATGGSTIVGCDGFDVSQSGVLDLDLRAVTVTGRVTLAGAPLPDEADSRGTIEFRGIDGRSSGHVELAASGPRTYSLRLPPGRYDVNYHGNPALCAWPGMPSVPCGSGRLVSDAHLSADGVLDVDIPVVTVSGNVTLKGAAFPDVGRRGSIAFGDARGGGGVVPLPPEGAAGYRMNLLPGTYDVSFVGDPSECVADAPPAVPCNSGTLRASIALASSGVLDLDVPAVHVTGVVTLNGSLPPTESSPRGQLAFTDEEEGVTFSKPFPPTGMMSYDVVLLPGRYAVAYEPGAELCAAPALPSMPCVGGTVLPARDLSSDGVLDVDLRAVTVTGQVTLNGAALPAEAADRGALSLTNEAGGAGVTRGLGAAGPGQYSMRLLAGAYDIAFVPNPELCATEAPPSVPCTGGIAGSNVMLQSDGVYDVDLERVRVSGAVTLNGASLPAAEGDRGSVTFSLGESSVATSGFGTSGNAAYALSLWPGIYRVHFDANADLCAAGGPAPLVPCAGGTLIAASALEADGVLDLDVRTVSLSGTVTLNGGPLPPAPGDRGSIAIVRAPGQGSGAVSHALGSDAAPSYAVTLLAGRYVFSHEANAALCSDAEVAPAVPCVSRALAGCE